MKYELVRADSLKTLLNAVNERAEHGVKLVCVLTNSQEMGVSAILDVSREGEE